MSFASGTSVSEEKSRLEIEKILISKGATQFGVLTDVDGRRAMISFRLSKLNVRMQIPLPDPASREFKHSPSGRRRYDDERAKVNYMAEVRRRWRCLALAVKAKMVAVGDGITTFENEFLAYVVTDEGMTIGAALAPMIESGKRDGSISFDIRPALPPGPNESAA